MEFTLRTPDGFRGRIYTYKHYDRPHCYIRGMSCHEARNIIYYFCNVCFKTYA